MSDKLWPLLVDFKIAERYYWYYIGDSKGRDDLISGICLLTSTASVSAWYIWKQFPLLWAVLIGLAQIISALKPLFPFYSRFMSARYIYQDISKLCIEAEHIWTTVNPGESATLEKYVTDFKRQYAEIESRFSTPDLFPIKTKLHTKAEKDANTYFSVHYQTKMKGGG